MPRAAGVQAGLWEAFFFLFLRAVLAGVEGGLWEVFFFLFLRAVLAVVEGGLREVFFFFLRAVRAGPDRVDLPVRLGSGLDFLIGHSLQVVLGVSAKGPGDICR